MMCPRNECLLRFYEYVASIVGNCLAKNRLRSTHSYLAELAVEVLLPLATYLEMLVTRWHGLFPQLPKRAVGGGRTEPLGSGIGSVGGSIARGRSPMLSESSSGGSGSSDLAATSCSSPDGACVSSSPIGAGGRSCGRSRSGGSSISSASSLR